MPRSTAAVNLLTPFMLVFTLISHTSASLIFEETGVSLQTLNQYGCSDYRSLAFPPFASLSVPSWFLNASPPLPPPFIHIYWCLLDGNIWSWRLMALYISLKKHHTPPLSSISFRFVFFLLTVSFSELFRLPCHFFPPCVISTKSIIRGAVCLRQWGLGSAFDSALNWCRDAGYCLSFVMPMNDESGKKSGQNWTAFPLTGLTYYKSNAV